MKFAIVFFGYGQASFRALEAVGAMPGYGGFFSAISGEEAAKTPLESIPT